MRQLWPHQAAGIQQTIEAVEGGAKAVCLTSPTGGGKSTIMTELMQHWHDCDSVLYTNRKMLMQQLHGVLERAGLSVGIRASGHEPALLRRVQLCMTQTEASQVYARKNRGLHPATKVFIDEAHVQKNGIIEQIIADHKAMGAAIIGFTATPLDIGHIYDELIVAGVNSELRACGALVKCHTYGVDEPDLRHVKNYVVGEDLSERDNVKAIMRPGIFGRVIKEFNRLNPERLPTILFGPGVKESLWFAEQFRAAGVSAAHIDGDDVWINGEVHSSDETVRAQVMEASKCGDIKVLCNRFVLREGIDAPWLAHGIFATVFGSLTSFLQSGGRLLRAHPSLDHVTLQDHGGNWHRHGSLNADREWHLEYSSRIAQGLREMAMREKREQEPICCPLCLAMRLSGDTCWKCGHRHTNKSRMVVQVDGTLREMKGDIHKPRRVKQEPDTQKKWDRYFHGARKSGRTFLQAEAFFAHEEHYWPPRTLNNMPTQDLDWFRSPKDVPRENLTGGAKV